MLLYYPTWPTALDTYVLNIHNESLRRSHTFRLLILNLTRSTFLLNSLILTILKRNQYMGPQSFIKGRQKNKVTKRVGISFSF